VPLDAASAAFGLCCAIIVQAMAGPGCALAITAVGVLLLLRAPPR
jgi:hypothetical protein